MANPLRTTNTWFFPACIIGCFAVLGIWMHISGAQERAYDSTIDKTTSFGRPFINVSDVTATHDETVLAQNQVAALMRKQFGSRLRDVNVLAQPGGGYTAGIRFTLGNDENAVSAKSSIETDMTTAYKIIYTAPIDIRLVSLFAVGLVQNEQKNQFDATVYGTSLTSSAADLVDWNHLTTTDLARYWEVITLNPVLGTMPTSTDNGTQ